MRPARYAVTGQDLGRTKRYPSGAAEKKSTDRDGPLGVGTPSLPNPREAVATAPAADAAEEPRRRQEAAASAAVYGRRRAGVPVGDGRWGSAGQACAPVREGQPRARGKPPHRFPRRCFRARRASRRGEADPGQPPRGQTSPRGPCRPRRATRPIHGRPRSHGAISNAGSKRDPNRTTGGPELSRRMWRPALRPARRRSRGHLSLSLPPARLPSRTAPSRPTPPA